MSNHVPYRTIGEQASIDAVAAELSQRGWQTTVAVNPSIVDVDLYLSRAYTSKHLTIRVKGFPRFGRNGEPEWYMGSWKFQSRPGGAERGLPFHRHPHYPGYWVLWDFAAHTTIHVFVWLQQEQGAKARLFVSPTEDLRRLLNAPPVWLEDYQGVRDRTHWLSLGVLRPFEDRWDLLGQD